MDRRARDWRFWIAALAIGAAACKDKADSTANDLIVCERSYAVCPSLARVATPEEVTDCSHHIDGPCGTTMRQYLQCAAGRCDDAGAVDRGGVVEHCSAIIDAYRSCALDAGDAHAAPSFPVIVDAGGDAAVPPI